MKLCECCRCCQIRKRVLLRLLDLEQLKLGHLLLLFLKELWGKEHAGQHESAMCSTPSVDAEPAKSSSPSARPQTRGRNLRACWCDLGSTWAVWRAWRVERSVGHTAPWRSSLPGGGWLFLQADGVKDINTSAGGAKTHWLKYININFCPREYCIVTYGLIDSLHAEVFYQRLAGPLSSAVRL